LKAIGFDRDGTLWYGDPPGPITKEHLKKAKAKGYVIGGSSGQSAQEQERQWRENNLEPNFVVTKSELPRLKDRFTKLIHVGDAQDDAEWAEKAGAHYMAPGQFIQWLNKVFDKYGEYYDLLYQDKDYEKECDFLESIFRKHSIMPIKSIFDGGCGTGGHAIPLARRGYEVFGVDASKVMIGKAVEKANKHRLKVDFRLADLCSINLDKNFDATICMFAVMDYFTTNYELGMVIRNMRKVLKDDALFIFDVWNGLAVLRILPETRVKVVEGDGKKVIRWVHPELDSFNHLCHDHYQLIVTEDGRVVDEIAETHTIRYFFPQEITHYLEENGFQVLEICPFLDLGGKVDENVWNMTYIARSRGA
jgi:SAM-dependent methyltransferase